MLFLLSVSTTQINGIIGATVMATAATLTLLFVLLYRTTVRRRISRLLRIITEKSSDSAEVRAVMAALDIGVLAYGSNDRLLTLNQMAENLLTTIPATLADFYSTYGETNGIKASMFLGAGSATGQIEIRGRTLNVTVQKRALDQATLSGHIVMIRDVSAEQREEERRKAFVANVSHELKTPLTTIKTYSESLLDWGIDEKDKATLKKDVKRLYDDSIRMEGLIEDLLLLSSLDSRGLFLKVQTLDFAGLVRQVTERMQLMAEEKGVALSCVVVAHIPEILGDRASLERILINLISNAIKYTEPGGEIYAYVGTIVDDVYVKVKDTGSGIAPEHHEHIFKRFFRVDTTGSRRFGGTGLGLSIVRELADLQRGKIELKSDIGKGSEFTLLIPGKRKVMRDTRTMLMEGNRPVDAVGRAAAEEIVATEALP